MGGWIASPCPWGCLPFQKPPAGLLRASRGYPWLRRSRPCLIRSRCPTQPPPLSLHPLCRWAIGAEAVFPGGALLITARGEQTDSRKRGTMPRQRSLVTVIRDMVQEEVRSQRGLVPTGATVLASKSSSDQAQGRELRIGKRRSQRRHRNRTGKNRLNDTSIRTHITLLKLPGHPNVNSAPRP